MQNTVLWTIGMVLYRLFCLNKEGNPLICDNMGEPRKFSAKWHKSENKHCIIPLIWASKTVKLIEAETRERLLVGGGKDNELLFDGYKVTVIQDSFHLLQELFYSAFFNIHWNEIWRYSAKFPNEIPK